MAFLRITRDKRGYEHFYLIQPTTRRGKNPRLWYWFRTPPHLKMGREPFDAEARRAIELGNPDITFDWKAIGETPAPPVVEPEKWRERRRLERVSRQSQPSAEPPDGPPADAVTEDTAGFAPGEDATLRVRATDLDPAAIPDPPNPAQPPVERRGAAIEASDTTATAAPAASNSPEGGAEAATTRRGRRRRRRRRGGRLRPEGPSPSGEEQTGQDPVFDDSPELATAGEDDDDADSAEGEAPDEPVSVEESKLPDPDEP